MKFFIIACVIFAAVIAQEEAARPIDPIDQEVLCPIRAKCGRGARPVIAHDNCQCSYFRTDCARKSYNAIMGPSYNVVLDDVKAQKYCPCYASLSWLDAPTTPSDSSVRCYGRPQVIDKACAYWLRTNCTDFELIPVVKTGSCGCKIFPNDCYYQQFNCKFQNDFADFESGDEQCDCKYTGPILSIAQDTKG